MSISYEELLRRIQEPEKKIPTIELPKKTPSAPEKDIILRCQSKTGSSEYECSVDKSHIAREEVTWLEIFAKYRNSILQVVAESVIESPFLPQESMKVFQSRGSGFFISEDGYLLTNGHVVLRSIQTSIRRESEGERFIPAKIVALSPSKDVALLKISQKEINKFKQKIIPPPLGNADELPVSSEVAALGFPLGMNDVKLTLGTIVGYHREASEENRITSYLQISSPITNGSSGGPLFNKNGQVIGINSAGIPNETAFGFAIGSTVVFSVLRNLFLSVYPDKIVPVSLFPFHYQTASKLLLKSLNVNAKYSGGLYITKRLNPYQKQEPDHDLQPKDVIAEIRFVNLYTPENNYLEVQTYRAPQFFPQSGATTDPSLSLSNILLEEEDGCTERVVITEPNEGEEERKYRTGGLQWNLTEKTAFPAYKVTFQPGDETVNIYEKKTKDDTWKLSPIFANRKMFFADVLDRIPSGVPLLYIVYRGGKKICLEKLFAPIPPEKQGLKLLYPPFQDFKEQYEILAGLVFMNLTLNHFQVCLPHIVGRLEGKDRFKPAVVITHLFGLSSVAKTAGDAITPLGILKTIELFGPEMEKEFTQGGHHHKYTRIVSVDQLSTIQEFRIGLNHLVEEGIKYFNSVIEPNVEHFRQSIRVHALESEIRSLSEAKYSWEEIDKILETKYSKQKKSAPVNQPRTENELIQTYLPSVNNTKAWHQLLTMSLTFQDGAAVYVGFPEIFFEDIRLQMKLQIPITPFADKLYERMSQDLIVKFNGLFKVPGTEDVRRISKEELQKISSGLVFVPGGK